MALKVWLPLNGNLENIGTDSIDIVNNGATVDNSGKIGKCYSFNGSNNYLKSTYNFYNNKFSVSAWVYSTKNNVTQTIVCDRTATGSGFSIFLISGKLRIDPGGNGLQWTTSYTYPVNTWFHLTVTHDGTNVSYYINGEFKETKAQALNSSYWGNTTSIGASQANNASYGNYLNGKLNDVRIYDHCLSKLEVKEIAQGLVLHYKLDGFSGGAGENLYIGSKDFSGTWVNGSAWTTAADKYNGFTVKQKSTTWGGLAQNISASTGDIFTISFWGKVDSGGNIQSIHRSNLGNVTTGLTILGGNFSSNTVWVQNAEDGTQWKRYWATLRVDSSDITYIQWRLENSVSGKNFYIAGIKLEKGSIATPWSLAPSELGKDLSKIVDSSGYENDGIVEGNISLSTDSPRYGMSTYFNNDAQWNCGVFVNNFTMSFEQYTISIWIKDSVKDKMSLGNSSSLSSGSNQFYLYGDNSWRYVHGGTAGEYYFSHNNSATIGDWIHYGIVYDGSKVQIYRNGTDEGSKSTTGLAIFNNISLGVGYTGPNYQAPSYISDFRIYATALSAEDVATLYKISAQIDKLKAFHTFAISEGNDKAVRKNGVTEIQNISEFDALSYLKYDPNLHIEPDGSAWIHIYHHNRPDLDSFASTDTFATSVKKDENRWFNGTQVCNQLNKWEFLIKYAFTQNGTEYKERWIQTKNPENAVFGDVDAADITRITGDGYKTGTWGGLYKKNGNAYWVQNNGSNGNWWGATGSFSIYQGGIPGYGGTVTTTGYNDLYVRIDNVLSTVSTNSRLTRNGILIGSNFIEK